jgi:hypothetical protein
MALKTINLPSERPKNEFGELGEAIFEVFERPYEVIFSILKIEISDLNEVASVIF